MSTTAPPVPVPAPAGAAPSQPATDPEAMPSPTEHGASAVTASAPSGRQAADDAVPTRDGFVVRHRLLLIALVLVVLFHGSLLLAGSYQRTYDAYVHIFFADHYARNWFSGWDDRWYTGFSTLSYPPGGHFAIAAVSKIVGLQTAFALVQLGALLLLTVGVYRWARIWVDQTAAGWASILLVLSSSIAETVHVFGQLPTTLSLGFLLNSLPYAHAFLTTGRPRALLLGIACTMATTACHHVTTLFGAVFFLGPVMVFALVAALRTALPDEPDGHPAKVSRRLLWPLVARRLRRALPTIGRTALYGGLVVFALLAVVLPYWLFSRSNPITQVSIPHASRDSFIANPNAGLVFWLIPWGTTLLVLPYALIRGFASKAWPLAASLLVLFVFGTGGTTPIPKMILGGSYDILTLDRFTFWATICVLPLAGLFVSSVVSGTIRDALVRQVGPVLAAVLPALLLAAHIAVTLFAANLTHYRPFQPAAIDIAPITSFLEKDEHDHWRYLTLGFGDQMAWLSANTTAQTVDGDYHSARALPELTSRPVERLENSKYAGVPGIGSLQQFLAVPERYNLKYVFSNDEFYAPLLDASGWTDLGPLSNGIEVWERADVPPLPVNGTSNEPPAWQRYLWGTVPPGSIVAALLLLAWSACGYPGIGRMNRLLTPFRIALHWLLTPLRRIRLAVDRRLAVGAARLPTASGADAPPRWLPWRPVLGSIRAGARRQVSSRRRQRQAMVVVIALVLAGLGTVVLLRPTSPTPQQVLTAYYDDLDFRRTGDAYDLLDPATRPDFVQYGLDLSADGGLVASFAKLDSVVIATVEQSDDRVVLRSTRTFLTSLESYDVVDTVVLVRDGGRWYIQLPAADPTQPQQQFLSRPEVGFLAQGRRAPATDGTSPSDVLDRPQLTLGELRALKVADRWVVIGQVTNVDVDPADVTVEAQLRDPDGVLLAGWDASQVLVHKLLPGASSPFRIEFQSIAGTGEYGTEADGGVTVGASGDGAITATAATPEKVDVRGPVEFDPNVITPLTLAPGAEVAAVDVYARAVVTPSVGVQGLQVVGLQVQDGDLVGTLRNDSTVEAAVPHLLISYLDAAGRLAWVDHAFLEHSVAPQRSTAFRIPLPTVRPEVVTDVPITGYAGPAHLPFGGISPMVALPESSGFAAAAVTTTSYVRGANS